MPTRIAFYLSYRSDSRLEPNTKNTTMKKPTKFIQLIKEAKEATNESSRLWRACKEKESIRRNRIRSLQLQLPSLIAHDHTAYAQIEGGKIICESTGSSNMDTIRQARLLLPKRRSDTTQSLL